MKKLLLIIGIFMIPMLLTGASTQDITWISDNSWYEYWGKCVTDTLIREVTTAETTIVKVDLRDYLSHHGLALMQAESTVVKYAQSPDTLWGDVDWTSWIDTSDDTTMIHYTMSLHPARYLELMVIESKKDTSRHTILYLTMFK